MFENPILEFAPNPVIELDSRGMRKVNANAVAREILREQATRHALRRIVSKYLRRLGDGPDVLRSGSPEKLGDAFYNFCFLRMPDGGISIYLYPEGYYEESRFDVLTGLPNRRFLDEAVIVAFRRALRHHEHVVVYYIDLNKVSKVNDTYGHECGDRLLARVGKLLKGVARSTDVVARVGGDEFVAVLSPFRSSGANGRSAFRFAERIDRALKVPIEIKRGKKVRVSASIGIYIGPRSHDPNVETPEELARRAKRIADEKMYEAKKNGELYRVFDDRVR